MCNNSDLLYVVLRSIVGIRACSTIYLRGSEVIESQAVVRPPSQVPSILYPLNKSCGLSGSGAMVWERVTAVTTP
jgi:hypothetical protein